jgi:hypothetical protein
VIGQGTAQPDILPRIRHSPSQQDHRPAARRWRHDEEAGRGVALDEARDGADLKQKRHDERNRAVRPDLMVSHDAQDIVSRAAAAEAIRHIGESIQVQRTRQDDACQSDQRRSQRRRQHPATRPQNEDLHSAHERTNQGKQRGRPPDRLRRTGCVADRNPREQRQGRRELLRHDCWPITRLRLEGPTAD